MVRSAAAEDRAERKDRSLQTDAGRALIDEAVEAYIRIEHRLLADLPASWHRRIVPILRELLLVLDGPRQDPG